MSNEVSVLEIVVGLAGVLLILHGILSILSSRYYAMFSKVYFIEPIRSAERARTSAQILDDHRKSRNVMSAFVIFFGITALAWALGLKWALGWPFSVLF